jgi:hypothetical protein
LCCSNNCCGFSFSLVESCDLMPCLVETFWRLCCFASTAMQRRDGDAVFPNRALARARHPQIIRAPSWWYCFSTSSIARI